MSCSLPHHCLQQNQRLPRVSKLVYSARQILAKINSSALLMELKVQTLTLANAPENHSPRTPPGLGSRICDQTPSVKWRGFQTLTWVRGGLQPHVTLSCSRMGKSEESTTTYFIASGAFFCISIKLPLPHLKLSSLRFHLVWSDTVNYFWAVMICHTSHVPFQKFPESSTL